jgi:hypothetical protein
MSVPEDLRDVLEICLAEDATPDNLAIYLPKVRGIITRLLKGLRSKQSMYRRIVSEQHPSRQRSGTSSRSRTNLPTPEMEPSVPPVQSAPVPASVKPSSVAGKPVSPPLRSPPAVIIEEPSPDRNDTNAVEASVTRLLVAIKKLLDSLTMWSNLQLTETQISDIYVRLANDFNAAVAAFAAFDIEMRCAPITMRPSSCSMPSIASGTSCPSPKTYVTSSKLAWLKTQHLTIWRYIYPGCARSLRAFCKASAANNPCTVTSSPSSTPPASALARPLTRAPNYPHRR